MANLNKVILIGRLGQDPEAKETPSGAFVANFSMATNEFWTDKQGEKQERTEWHNVVAWDKLADLANNYLHRGSNIYCEGKLQTRSWESEEGEKKYKTEIVASNIQFLDKKEDSPPAVDHVREEKPVSPMKAKQNEDVFKSMESALRKSNPDMSDEQIMEMMDRVNPGGKKTGDDIPF